MASSQIDYTEYGTLMIFYVIIYTSIALLLTYLVKGSVLDPWDAVITGVAIVLTSVIFLFFVITLYSAGVIKTNPNIIA